MERRTRRKFNADFKAKVVLEVLKERSSLEELARKYELHPNQLGTWKKEFLSKASIIFESEEKAEYFTRTDQSFHRQLTNPC